MLGSQWYQRSNVKLKHPMIDPDAFEAVMLYLYTNSVNIETEKIPAFLLMCKQCHLYDLMNMVAIETENNNNNLDRFIIIPTGIEEIF